MSTWITLTETFVVVGVTALGSCLTLIIIWGPDQGSYTISKSLFGIVTLKLFISSEGTIHQFLSALAASDQQPHSSCGLGLPGPVGMRQMVWYEILICPGCGGKFVKIRCAATSSKLLYCFGCIMSKYSMHSVQRSMRRLCS